MKKAITVFYILCLIAATAFAWHSSKSLKEQKALLALRGDQPT